MAWGWNWLETFLQDAGYGLRCMLRTPGHVTVVALEKPALGISATPAICHFLDAMILRSTSSKNSRAPTGQTRRERLEARHHRQFRVSELYSYPFSRQLQQKNAVFSDTSSLLASMMNNVHGFVDSRQDPELIHAPDHIGHLFQTLGVEARIGPRAHEPTTPARVIIPL